jgi:hypothetical protein
MKPEEIQKLLGGYATGTLTPEEQQALFEAALHDQELFDALAKEQPLRDLLRDPAARAHVLAAIEEQPRPWWKRAHRWVLAGAAAAACLAVAAGVYFNRPKPAVHPVLVAETKLPSLPAPVMEIPKPEAVPPVKVAPAKPKLAVARGELTPRPAAVLPPAAPTPAAAPPPVPQSTTQSVEVTAAAPALAVNGANADALPAQNARALFYLGAQNQFLPAQGGAAGAQFQPLAQRARTAGTLAVPNLGVKWTALRKQPDGLFSEVDPEQIKAGDVIKLRLVPNDNGFLSVMEGTRPLLAEKRALRLQPFETPEITSGAGKKELTVVLARQAQQAPQAKQPQAAGLIRAAANDQLSQADRGEHAVYEVNTGSNLFAPVLVKITLNFQ